MKKIIVFSLLLNALSLSAAERFPQHEEFKDIVLGIYKSTDPQKKRSYFVDLIEEAPKYDYVQAVKVIKEQAPKEDQKNYLQDLLWEAPKYNAIKLLNAVLYELGKDADVNRQGAADGATPLHNAAKGRSIGAAKLLLKSGADPMIEDDAGKKPHEYAQTREMQKLLRGR